MANRMKTATFFEALASAKKNRGERWHAADNKMIGFFFNDMGWLQDIKDERLIKGIGEPPYWKVSVLDLTNTWVCETEGKDGE